MKRVLAALLFFVVFPFSLISQENAENPFFDAFVKNFEKSNTIATKIELLQDAADVDQLGMAKIYVMALEYVLNNVELLKSDPLAVELATLSVRLVASVNYAEANGILWKLFGKTENTTIRVEILNTFGTTAKDDPDFAQLVAGWLNSRNLLYSDAEEVDLTVLGEAITTLGKIGNTSAFPVLFSVSLAGYPLDIRTKTKEALASIKGDISEHLVTVMHESPVKDKIAAIDLASQLENIKSGKLGEIAMAALSYGVSATVNTFEEKKEIATLRAKAAAILADLSWSEAAGLMIDHFDQTISEYENGIAGLQILLDAIKGLGLMGNHEAAVRLTLYLEVLNFNLENGQKMDEQIIMAVIASLGRLGDKVALDSLLYVKYLDYSNSVKKAAREAQKNLKIR